MALRSATAAQHVDHVIVTAGTAVAGAAGARNRRACARPSRHRRSAGLGPGDRHRPGQRGPAGPGGSEVTGARRDRSLRVFGDLGVGSTFVLWLPDRGAPRSEDCTTPPDLDPLGRR
ncbi:hypothetical protein BN11_50004 [Nostocoides australiense Ben110]|uniref:Uncharacterized protein n=1 Tax=Nostocoides australiense Ben110 TaxID=1193182 RepID=W6JZG7_9MICO|nr:hypothetical protein BN11_50004 [Tetrasphaera australiensis Ben110]